MTEPTETRRRMAMLAPISEGLAYLADITADKQQARLLRCASEDLAEVRRLALDSEAV